MRPVLLLAAVLAAGSLPCSGQAEELTLSRCLALARQKSVESVQAALTEQQAAAASQTARSGRLPQLFFSGQLLRSDDASTNLPDDNNATINLEQRLLPFNSGWERVQQQDALYKAAVLAKVESQQDVDLAVKRLYFSILQAEDAERGIDQVDSQLRRLLDTVVPKYTVGRAPAFDPIKVRAALADLARDRGNLEAKLGEERETLALVTGLQDGSQASLAPVSAFPPLPGPGLIDQALAANPTLKTQEKRIEAARLGVMAARALRYPDVVGHLDYNYADYTTGGMAPGWTASVAMELPIFDWGGISGQIKGEQALLAKEQLALEADRQEIRESMAGALGRAKAHEENRRTYEDLLPRVHEVAVAGVNRYRLGATGILEATDSVSLWLNTLLDEREAYYSYLSDLAELERLSGGALQVSYEK